MYACAHIDFHTFKDGTIAKAFEIEILMASHSLVCYFCCVEKDENNETTLGAPLL